MFPSEDPKYVIVVVLDEVGSGPVSGGYTAGQIFQTTATRVILSERLASSQSETFEVGAAPAALTSAQRQAQSGQSLFGRP